MTSQIFTPAHIAADLVSGTAQKLPLYAAPTVPIPPNPGELDGPLPFNQLTPAEAERLALLAEECGEVIQAVGKILRHGYESRHPNGGPTNREALERECGDVYHCIWMLIAAHDIDGNGMSQRADDKAKSVTQYLHHQPGVRIDRADKKGGAA